MTYTQQQCKEKIKNEKIIYSPGNYKYNDIFKWSVEYKLINKRKCLWNVTVENCRRRRCHNATYLRQLWTTKPQTIILCCIMTATHKIKTEIIDWYNHFVHNFFLFVFAMIKMCPPVSVAQHHINYTLSHSYIYYSLVDFFQYATPLSTSHLHYR